MQIHMSRAHVEDCQVIRQLAFMRTVKRLSCSYDCYRALALPSTEPKSSGQAQEDDKCSICCLLETITFCAVDHHLGTLRADSVRVQYKVCQLLSPVPYIQSPVLALGILILKVLQLLYNSNVADKLFNHLRSNKTLKLQLDNPAQDSSAGWRFVV